MMRELDTQPAGLLASEAVQIANGGSECIDRVDD